MATQSPMTKIEAATKLLTKTDQIGDCWIWTGGGKEYGYIRALGGDHATHRLSFQLFNGPLEDGMVVAHSCHNKKCVNPSHLKQCSGGQNVLDSIPYRKTRTTKV